MKFCLSRTQYQDTCLAITFLLLVLWLFTRREEWIYAAGLLLLLGMVFPLAMRPLALIWFGLSETLGKVVSRILLTMTYLLILLPVALMLRLQGKDFLKLREWHSGKASCWVVRNHHFSADDLNTPY